MKITDIPKLESLNPTLSRNVSECWTESSIPHNTDDDNSCEYNSQFNRITLFHYMFLRMLKIVKILI